ncbi:hypothetical protein [Sporosarcina sp. HYO08]|nr:hypothetical protein [Sporosarcina sp. HYO08]
MKKTIQKPKRKRGMKQITVTVTVSKELGGLECAKYLMNIGAYKEK